MATRFVRVDLSEEARDYRPIAVEPGVPMLDRSGANNRIVFRWLGGMAAEPTWENDLVGFYVRDDKGGRLEDVIVQPASAQDLQGLLRDDLAKLRQRLDQSRGETPTERTLRKILMRSFQDLVDNPARTDLDSYFFRYRDVLGNWRLIWCWGYERLDHEPAPAVVCTDPDCNLLFVRRPGKSPRCPSCEGVLVPRKKRKTKRNLALLALLLLALLAGGLGWWLWWRPALIVAPTEFAGLVGSRIDCHVLKRGLFANKDVTHDTLGITIGPQVAHFDRETGTIRLTGVGDTKIEFRYGNRHVDAVVTSTPSGSPDKLVSLELSPAGDVSLPLGQMVRLQAYANYGDGRRVAVPSERLKWFSEEKSAPGLELYTGQDEVVGAVGALKAGAGPLSVYARYGDQESNRVVVRSVEADPNVKLDIDVDRTLRLAGEQGRVVLTASSPGGDVDLVPSLTSFKSSADKVLKVAEASGKFATSLAGTATVVGNHPAAKDPAQKEFRVCDPAKAKLLFDPANARLTVNQRAALPLWLVEMEDDGKKEKQRAPMLGQGVAYYVAQPQAVRLYPPSLTGLQPAPPFEIQASIPVLPAAATAKVEVVAAESKALRITSSAASPLAAGQAVALKVEQQVGDSDWQEVRPDAVTWSVPTDQVAWTPPTETLRPTVTLLPDVKGEVKLAAALGDKAETVAFTLKEAGPDAKDPAARLVLNREPEGKLLPLGQSQRYAVIVDKDGHQEPAADVHWPENFENEYVKWEAPVLTAKKEGYTQFLRAEAGGRNVLWHTTTFRPSDYTPPHEEEPKPDLVKIFSQQGSQQVQNVRFPVGAVFTDFKVEVHYPDGFTRFVTKKAVLRTKEPAASAPLTAEHGKFVGLRPGSTEVTAEFQGLASQVPLKVDVTADVEVDKIAIEPGSIPMRPGENFDLHVIGYKDGKSVGDITGLGNLNWKSSKPDVARVAGAAVIASSLGESDITVERKGLSGPALTSDPAKVTVANTTADLRVEPQIIQMYEGETQQLGDAIRVLREDLDVSQQATAVPESPGVVQFDPATHSLHAIQVGEVPLGIAMGDKVTQVKVVVRPHAFEVGSKLVVEPGSVILAPGQAERLTANIETPSGDKLATMAALKSADPTVVSIDEATGRIRALKPGKTEVKAFVVGMPTATVPVEVTSEEITELGADPTALNMAVGDHQHLRIFGKAPSSGTKEMFPQQDLVVAAQNPSTVDVIGGEDVQAKAIGTDTINAAWRGKLKVAVPVRVAADTISGLQIEPRTLTVHPGQAVTYGISATRNGNSVILTPADGLRLNVTDPRVASVASGATVLTKGLGQTKVVAEIGGQRAEADLNVTPGGDVIVADNGNNVFTDRVIYGDNGNRVVIGGGQTVIPAGKVVGLSFEPPFYRAGVQAMPQTAKLHRVYANGGFDDVSNEAKITSEPKAEVARLEKVDGGWRIHHVAPGLTKVTATLDGQSAEMGIEIMGDAVAGQPLQGTLVVDPRSVLDLWSGETKPITGMIDPGGGQPAVPVEVTVKAPDGQGIVAVEGNKVTGRSVGDVVVTVSGGGQTAAVNVHVAAADAIYFNPPSFNLQAGDSAAPAVMAKSADGTEVAVQAAIESLDKNVLDANPAQPGQFVARSQGQTQLKAVYRGKEVFAQVSVSGKRFETVKPVHNHVDKDTFDMTIEVLAAAAEGELEYRVYDARNPNPEDKWVPNVAEGSDKRKVTLRSDRIRYDSGDQYNLVIEARDKKTQSVQKYPLTLVRSITVEQQKQAPESTSPPAR
jgi:hypothetical protein